MAEMEIPEAPARLAVNKRILIILAAVVTALLLLFVFIALQGVGEKKDRLHAVVKVAGRRVLAVDLFEDGLIMQSDGYSAALTQEGKELLIDLAPMDVPVVLKLNAKYRLSVSRSGCKDQKCVKAGAIHKLDETLSCPEYELTIAVEQKTVL